MAASTLEAAGWSLGVSRASSRSLEPLSIPNPEARSPKPVKPERFPE
jgi:hypothetical protein